MWARVVEFMLGCWLAVSPFVFQHGDATVLWRADFAAALTVIVLALLSYWQPTRQAHLGIALLALMMIAFGRFGGGGEILPAYQNHMLVGMLLLMFAIVPNNASRPPAAWYGDKAESITSGSS